MPSEAPAAVPHANSRVHVFYYNWWGTPEHDGAWFHWDHEVLDDVKPRRRHDPAQGRIGSTHWPQLGPYSSADPAVVARHCRQLREAGAGVLVVAWYSRDRADQKADLFAGFQDRSIPLIAAEAAKVGLRVAFHSEPYPGRSAASVAADAAYICREYGALPGVYRHDGPRGALPMLYVYDSYQVAAGQWAAVLGPGLPMYAVGLAVERKHLDELRIGRFDGVYTYFASNGFVWGSTTASWAEMGRFCRQHSMLWIPCAGPGYDDTQVRPWNARNTKDRRGGAYFAEMLTAAAESGPSMVGVTSFNEWHEGTQIEPAAPRPGYPDYAPLPPEGYLALLARHAATLK